MRIVLVMSSQETEISCFLNTAVNPQRASESFDVRHLRCVNHKLTVGVPTAINTTNWLCL